MKKERISKKELKHKARRKMIKEGIYASTKSSFGDEYIAPLAIAINASNSLVAMLSSISGLLGPLSQLFGSKLMNRIPRKKILTGGVLFEALLFLPFIFIAILFQKNILTQLLPLSLALFFAIYIFISNIGHPVYFSWIGDIVDKQYRGRWFSKRTLIAGFTSIITAIIAAIILDYFKGINAIMFGFAILFFIAFFTRLKCHAIYKAEYYPKIKFNKKESLTFWKFLKEAPKNNFGKFTIYRSILSFAIAISSPLLAIYLLRNLSLGYLDYMIIIFAGTFFSLFTLNIIGKISDYYGSYKVIKFCSIFVPLIPIAWILSSSKIYLIIVPSIIGGISWAGINLATKSFIYENVPSEKRGLAVSYFNLLNGIGIFLGALVSAFLIEIINTKSINPIIFIFILGAIARLIVVIIWNSKVKEIKKNYKLKNIKEVESLILKEAKPALKEEIHEIASIPTYLKER